MFTIHVLSMQSASTPIMELTAVVLRDIKGMDLLDVHQVWYFFVNCIPSV